MKIFLSWSGETSKIIANQLSLFLKENIQITDPWISTEIEKGTLWMNEILQGVQASDFGIVVVTPDNLNSIWLHFEAGALANLPDRNVAVLLWNVEPTELKPPLSLFNCTSIDKEDISKLLFDIKNIAEAKYNFNLKDVLLTKLIEKNYEETIELIKNKILTKVKTKTEPSRSNEDKIDEILLLSRDLSKSILPKDKWFNFEMNGRYFKEQKDGYFVEVKLTNGKVFTKTKDSVKGDIVWLSSEVNSFLISAVQIALNDFGYNLKADNKFGVSTKTALKDFQKKKNLPIGALDYETLKALGLK